MVGNRKRQHDSGDQQQGAFHCGSLTGAVLARFGAAALAIAISACGSAGDHEAHLGGDQTNHGGVVGAAGPPTGDSGFWPAPNGGTASSAATADAGSPANDAGSAASPGNGLTLGVADAGVDATSALVDAGYWDAGATPDTGSAVVGDAGPADDASSSACSGGRTWFASDAVDASTSISAYGKVQFNPPNSTHIVELRTTLTVPDKPTGSSTLYVWPGLEPWPGGDNFDPAGQGVLQPVLTWGTSCGTYTPQRPTGWWIAPQYINPYTIDPGYYGCMGGNYIDVQVGDVLDISMSLKGTVWTQLVVDRKTGRMTSFDMDLMGQAQNWALLEIEVPTQNRPTSDVIFTSTTLKFSDPSPSACQPSKRGADDYFSAPQSSADGTSCCISRIVLRARGVAATTPNMP